MGRVLAEGLLSFTGKILPLASPTAHLGKAWTGARARKEPEMVKDPSCPRELLL